MISLQKFASSVRFALAGLIYIVRREQNFQIDLVAAAVVIVLMILLPLRTIEYVILSLAIVSVLVMEIINTVFERMIDVLKPRVHPYAKVMKDMMAAAVLLRALEAAADGILIFFRYLHELRGIVEGL